MSRIDDRAGRGHRKWDAKVYDRVGTAMAPG